VGECRKPVNRRRRW